MARRGYVVVEEAETGRIGLWARCEINGCPNLVYLHRSTRFCYPHGPAEMSLNEMLRRFTCEPVPDPDQF